MTYPDPARIQIQSWRYDGGRKPDDVVVVARPSRWGNPFLVRDMLAAEWCQTEEEAVDGVVRWFDYWLDGEYSDPAYRSFMLPDLEPRRRWMLDNLPQLRGKRVACYCPLTAACHGDSLARRARRL